MNNVLVLVGGGGQKICDDSIQIESIVIKSVCPKLPKFARRRMRTFPLLKNTCHTMTEDRELLIKIVSA